VQLVDRRPLNIIEQDATANDQPRLWISALYAKLTDLKIFIQGPLRCSFTLEPRLRLNVAVVMSTDLNSDSEWLRRLIEVMHTIDAPCNGSFASKCVTQGLLDRLGLPADHSAGSRRHALGRSAPYSPTL